MGYSETLRRGDSGQLDRLITVRVYSLARNEHGESVQTLTFEGEVWAKRAEEGTLVNFEPEEVGNVAPYSAGSWIVRYDGRFVADNIRIEIEVDGVTEAVNTVTAVGRNRYMVLGD